ncbi:MAG: hypothetical protein RJA11_831 [Bacteroidota bacterium]|jgi:hypothetical protein
MPNPDHDYWDSWDYRDFQMSCAIPQSHKSYKSQYRPRSLGFLGLPGDLRLKYRNESHNPTNPINLSTDHDSWDYRDFQMSCAIPQSHKSYKSQY